MTLTELLKEHLINMYVWFELYNIYCHKCEFNQLLNDGWKLYLHIICVPVPILTVLILVI
jgi:hypothetical protein